jgi:hypothetical protein
MDRRHLLKLAALSVGASIAGTCSRALVSGGALDAAPQARVLDDEQLHQIATIAELIIPQTDTPGAIAAGVPEFIHRIVTEWYTEQERTTFMQGLAGVDAESRTRFGSRFLGLSTADQTTVLRVLEAQTRNGGRTPGHGAFFAQIKELTVLGYYTSEIGARAELGYRPVPGAYDGHAHFAG